jgi:hypothetical protein
MSTKMDPPFRVRRVTTKALDEVTLDTIDKLHTMNLDKILHLIENKGLNLKDFIMSDQFGLHFFPNGKWVWARKGQQHVEGDGADDKRQFEKSTQCR